MIIDAMQNLTPDQMLALEGIIKVTLSILAIIAVGIVLAKLQRD